MKRIIATIAVLMITAIGYASGVNPSLDEHADFLQTVIAALIFVLMFFSQRTLNRMEKNQGILFEKMEKLSAQVQTIQGEHNIMMGRCAPAPTEKEDLRTMLRQALAEVNGEIREDRRKAAGE